MITDAREYHERLRELTFAQADAGASADEAVAAIEPGVHERYPDWDPARVGRRSASAASTPSGRARAPPAH